LENKTFSSRQKNPRCKAKKENAYERQSFQYTFKDIKKHRLGKHTNLPLISKKWKMEA